MSKVIKVEEGDYILDVPTGRTIIKNDLVVNGISYGTAPVVTNILYVTMDGSDTNDGSGQDPTRACRTISGATKSPLYQPGTSIKVAPGHYYENNPINVKPYTSIIGSDLRTSTVEPINKTQDLFHVNSSCYLAQMQFLNGRSGIVDPKLDRGAYAVTFPINNQFSFSAQITNGSPIITNIDPILVGRMLLGMEIIGDNIPSGAIISSVDSVSQITISSNATLTGNKSLTTGNILVYKSPYVQNCTNQSGPWLYDGTMFRPNQTIQVPIVVGTATINIGDTSVSVTKIRSTGGVDISAGMAVNTGQKDQGFFDARTLIISNITFIQEIIIEWIQDNITQANDLASIWYKFDQKYDKEKCRRDIAIIVEHVLYDTTFGGNSKSIQAGLAYLNAVKVITDEKDQTIVALTQINLLVDDIITQRLLIENANTNSNKLPIIRDGSFIIGNKYIIVTIGNTNWSTITGITKIGIVKIKQLSGTGKTGNLVVSIDPPDLLTGTQASATATVSNGDITFVITDPGSGYTKPPIVTVSTDGLDGGSYTYQVSINTYLSGDLITAVSAGDGADGTAKPYQYRNANLGASSSNPAIVTFSNNMNIVKDIIQNGSASGLAADVFVSTGPENGFDSAELLLQKNKIFIQKEITTFLRAKFPTYAYGVQRSERDIAYIVDAISQDILLGGNSRTIESALAYYPTVTKSIERGEILNYPETKASVLTQSLTNLCLAAFDRLEEIMLQIIDNVSVTASTNVQNPYTSPELQITDPKLANGVVVKYAIQRNMTIFTDIVKNGPMVASSYIKYTDTSLFKTTGISADDVQLSSTVVSVTGNGPYTVTLDKPIIGVGTNEFTTLYFGYTSTYPLSDKNVPDEWESRRCDPNGSIGGVLVDGNVVSDRSPVKSFVLDAFTQVNQGGRGVRVTNRGYIQLVSVFTLFSSVSVQADNGGIASITNSNANFGDYCMIAKGYGPREFSGTIYNPSKISFNSITNSFEYNNYYPAGFFPNTQKICIFVPDTQYRPHIALMMEVVPPSKYINAKNKPGFLTSTVTISTITKGELFISDIDVTGMFIGQTVYIYDQFGRYADPSAGDTIKPLYIPSGTVITDIQPRTIYLSNSINVSAGDVNNPNYFTLFTCGKAYYTILSSTIANNPTRTSTNPSIPANGYVIPIKQRTTNDHDYDNPEIASLLFLKQILKNLITGVDIVNITLSDGSSQTIRINIPPTLAVQDRSSLSVLSGNELTHTEIKIDNLLSDTIDIIKDNTVVSKLEYNNGILTSIDMDNTRTSDTIPSTPVQNPKLTVSTSGTTPGYYTRAAQIINNNLDFCVETITAYISLKISQATNTSNWYQLTYNTEKCRRDIKLICVNIAYDLISGGNYNSVYSGLSYFSRSGTYHIVELEDNVSLYSLFPDGALVNFYQRSYMSASGYLFEYVGAGTNYGALPQIGRVDPKSKNEVNMLDGGKVFYTSTDQNGDFSIGPELVISQATGTLSGRTFQKSLYAEMTPFILAIEG